MESFDRISAAVRDSALGYWLSSAQSIIAAIALLLFITDLCVGSPLGRGAIGSGLATRAMHCMAAVSSDNALEDVEPSTNVKAMAARDRMIILSFDIIEFITLPH